jgi:hypothetical protein
MIELIEETLSKELVTKYEADIAAIVSAEHTVLNINTQEEYDNASKFIRQIKALADEMDEKRKELKEPHQKKADEIDGWFNPRIKSLVSRTGSKVDSAEARIKAGMIRYQQIQEEKARELQRIADEAARKERERIEREAKEKREKEEALRKQAEAAATEKEKEKLLKKADAFAEKAEEIEEQKNIVVAPVYQVPKQKGDNVRWRHNGLVIDKPAFIKYCVDSKLYYLLDVNQKFLDNDITKYKGDIKIPGVVNQKKPVLVIS